MPTDPTAPPAPTSPTGLNTYRTGAGEPLVLLHGMGESLIGWKPAIGRLAQFYDVIAVDLPGFGRSPALPAGVTPTAVNLAAAIEKALDEMGIGAYHVAGYSLGARVALELAGTDRVRSVIAMGPDGLGTPAERLGGYLGLVAARGVATILAPIADILSSTPAGRAVFFTGNRSLPWQLTPADARDLLTDYADAPAYAATNLAAAFDTSTHLQHITQPVLFLQGTNDPITYQVLRYLPLIPHVRLQLLPGMNHVPISDDPTAVTTHMLRFLDQAAAR